MLAANESLKNEVDAACRNWAVKDLDCPAKGCFGFSFTLDKNFNAGRALKIPAGGSSHAEEVPALDHAVCSDDDDRRTTRVSRTRTETNWNATIPNCRPTCTPAGPRQPKQGRAVGNRR